MLTSSTCRRFSWVTSSSMRDVWSSYTSSRGLNVWPECCNQSQNTSRQQVSWILTSPFSTIRTTIRQSRDVCQPTEVKHREGGTTVGYIATWPVLINRLRWRRGVVVASLVSINDVNSRWARLVLGWVTVSGFDSWRRHFISVCNQPPRSTQPSTVRRRPWDDKMSTTKGRWCSAAAE